MPEADGTEQDAPAQGMIEDPAEYRLLKALDALVFQAAARDVIQATVERVEMNLLGDPAAKLAWEPVALSAYGSPLPAAIRSSWVFVLRARITSGAERHPNSHQRVMSYRGTADLQTWNGSRWEPNVLTSERTAPLERRWLSIPVNVWHKPVMGDHNWAVVSFHTALPAELVEERGHPEQEEGSRRRTYL